ncbi:MAG: malic enzyme-like NAD(P)-binding protein, partial [archaeon]|nr:malic enzyme-like NAD(P)-binding protein [archaeon]
MSLKTNFEVSELEILRQKFLKLSGASASLDLERFTEALRTLGVDDEQEIQRLFYMFDEDKNGAVDFREFAVNLSILMRGSDDQRIAFVFKVLDEDEDGKINLGQYSRYLKANKVMDKATNDDILGAIIEHSYLRGDLDADGLLTIAEFKSAVSHARIVCPSPVSGLSLGDHLSPGEQELLSLLGSTISFQPGQELQDPSTAKNFFLVLSGSYITTPRSNPDIVLESGDARGTFLRQRSLFGGAPGRFLTLAQSQVTLLSIPNEPFLELVYHGHPAATSLTGKLGNTMLQRIKRFEKVLIDNHLLDDEFKAEKESISAGWSLIYHSLGVNGKLRVEASKQIGSVEDLSVAYSPGVAEPCLAIARDPDMAFEYTCRGHLVGVVSNGTAVLGSSSPPSFSIFSFLKLTLFLPSFFFFFFFLNCSGLGNIGALASKPVMEGKAVLFKKFAGLDSFDIELNEDDPQKLVDHIVALEPTFGGINIEDVKAPECFFVERECQKRMKICVMHDDAHGTSVIAGAGLLNALEIVQKRIEDIRVTVCGVGAAGFTCAKYFRRLGVKAENIVCVDKDGVVYKGRKDLVNDPELYLHFVALDTEKRTLADAVADCDVFLGLSAGNLLKPHLLKSMRRDPLIFALANPTPEI